MSFFSNRLIVRNFYTVVKGVVSTVCILCCVIFFCVGVKVRGKLTWFFFSWSIWKGKSDDSPNIIEMSPPVWNYTYNEIFQREKEKFTFTSWYVAAIRWVAHTPEAWVKYEYENVDNFKRKSIPSQLERKIMSTMEITSGNYSNRTKAFKNYPKRPKREKRLEFRMLKNVFRMFVSLSLLLSLSFKEKHIRKSRTSA